MVTEYKSIIWKDVPKTALVDVLRNWSLGPSNLSRQDKSDLVAIAEAYLLAYPLQMAKFRADLDREIEHRRNKKAYRDEPRHR